MLSGKSYVRTFVYVFCAGLVGVGLGVGPGLAFAADDGVGGPGSVVILLDSSGSMKEPAGNGKTRMESAKIGLSKVIEAVPAEAKVGLRVYGASISDGPKSCKDTDLLVPVQTVDKAKLKAAVKQLKPLGNTPIAYSLKQAAGDLPDEGARTIVLVSDGQGNCNADPCEVARDISDSGVKLHVDVIGLQVDEESRNQLSCIAKASGGTYYDVQDAVNLPNTLERLSVRAARGYEPAGMPVEGGTSAPEAVEVTDGQWLDNIGDSGQEFYSVPDPGKGTLHLAATLRPMGLYAAEASGIRIEVASAEGSKCGVGGHQATIGVERPITATYILLPETRKECGKGPYTVMVDAPDISTEYPLSLQVISEPGVETTKGLPSAATEDDFAAKGEPFSSDVSEVKGSTSPTNAPTIEAGTYTDTILPGELLFYRVELDWGQQLVCDGKIAAAPSMDPTTVSPLFVGLTYGFQGGKIFSPGVDGYRSGVSRDEVGRVHSATLPVRYLNRTAGDNGAHTSMPGGYYCGFYVSGDAEDAKDLGNLELAFNVSVVGTAGEGAPEYLEKPESAKKTDDRADAASADSGGGTSWGVTGGIVAAIVILLGAAWAYFRRMRPAK